MGMADALIEDWHRRYGTPGPPKDVWMQAQVELLRNLLRRTEMILEDNEVPRVVIRTVIRELIYGGYPNPAEAEIRVQYQDMTRDALMRL
jgi:hypothetical protein